MTKGQIYRVCTLTSLAALALGFAACSGSGGAQTASPTEVATTAAATTAATTASPGAATASATAAARVSPPAGATPGFGLLAPAGSGTASTSATPLSSQQLDTLSLTSDDLPSGFAITGSGPGGPELGRDVLASYQEEFQPRDITSTQSLQQTLIVIDLLGQYKDTSSALSGLKAVNAQNLNQLLGSVNLSAETATIPTILDDSSAFHFSGDTNGTSIGGYMVLFHNGPIATLVLTASVKGSESLQQTIDIAQKQAQKLKSNS